MTRGSGLKIVAVGLGFWLAAMPARAGEVGLRLDHDILVDLPEGWSVGNDRDSNAATGRRRVQVVCDTEACRHTQETCTFVLQRKPVEGVDDAARLAGLYASALSRYARLRAVLKNTSEDARIRQTLALARIGQRDWYVVETDAKPGFKSGLFAETVIGGWYLGAICKTCETGEIRYESAREMLSTVRRADPGAS